MTRRPAVFLDRDGTVIEQVHYLRDPSMIKLLPRVTDSLRKLRAAGYACVLVTNQSAIGRSLLTVAGLHEVQNELDRQLSSDQTAIDGWYYCPLAPTSDSRSAVEHQDRKPGPGMLLRAARELQLSIAQSWMVGDMISDVLAGRNAGCKGTILVRTGKPVDQAAVAVADFVVDDLYDATEIILDSSSWLPDKERDA